MFEDGSQESEDGSGKIEDGRLKTEVGRPKKVGVGSVKRKIHKELKMGIIRYKVFKK